MPRGAVLCHHQDAWHGTGPNATADRPRRSLVVHLLRDAVAFEDADASDYLRHPGAPGAANYIYARYKRLGEAALDAMDADDPRGELVELLLERG